MTFLVGQSVRVDARSHRGHHRTPGYLKGRTGRVVRRHTSFTNPETRAYGEDGLPLQPLYLVGFAERDVWPDHASGNNRIYADIFEHWLQADE